VIAFLALICTPLPFVFFKYGPHLRRKSRYANSTEGEKSSYDGTVVGDALEPGLLPGAGEDHGRTKMTV
jgi:hypothetical protein